MIHDLKTYPSYKDSGVSWLGKVPEHWDIEKIKNLARNGHKTFVDGDWIESPYIKSEGIRLIQTGNIGVGVYKEKGFRYISEDIFHKFGCTEFKPNDILICRLGDPVGRACLAPRLGTRMITSVDVCILKPHENVNAAFSVYAMSCPQYLEWVGSLVRGSTRDRVSRSMLGRFSIPLPPLPEQSAIVHYLDYMDRRIRRYIHAKKKLIKLLEEQKQAIIHQAVTRGLDPNVKLKPSGVEWLGGVPEHWEVTKLYRITDPQRPIMYGIVLPGPNVEEGVFIVKGGNCEPGRLRAECLSRTTFEIERKCARSRLKEDDIVYAIRGSIGAAELLPTELVGANLTQDAARIAPGVGILPKWLLYFVRSKAFFSKLDAGAVGATIRGINIRDLKRADVIVPPINEQLVIAEYLEAKNKRFTFLIERAQQEISLLREYRTRLIADVVTGKLDVREAAANLPEETELTGIIELEEELEETNNILQEMDEVGIQREVDV